VRELRGARNWRFTPKNQLLENCQESAGTQATNIENPRVGGSIPPLATTNRWCSKHLHMTAATQVAAV
jgi:hypothetical protein